MSDRLLYRRETAKFNATQTLNQYVKGMLFRLGYNCPVQVKKVHDDQGNDLGDNDKNIMGLVDVQPLIKQIDGAGNTYRNAIIYNVPYIRAQGGNNAIIIDPKVGDIGYVLISGRDISKVIKNKREEGPASYRLFSFSDAVYVGGILNDAPKNYVKLHNKDGSISVKSSDAKIDLSAKGDVTIKTDGKVSIQASQVKANCDIVTDGDVKAGNISLRNHVHGNGHNGSPTGLPEG